MAFDPMGNFSRVHSWQQDRDNGIRILADRHDQEDDNFAGGLNLCFLRTGTVPMTGNLQMGGNSIHTIKAGSEAAPSVTWELSNSTGLWQSSPASIAVSSNGVKRFEVNNTGVGIFGDTAFNGNLDVTQNLHVHGTLEVNGTAEFTNIATKFANSIQIVSNDTTNGYVNLQNTVANWTIGMLGAVNWSQFSIYNNLTGHEAIKVRQDDSVNIVGALTVNGAAVVGQGLNVGTGLRVQNAGGGGGITLAANTASLASRSWGFTTDIQAYGDFAIQQSSTHESGADIPRIYINANGDVKIGGNAQGAVASTQKLRMNNDCGTDASPNNCKIFLYDDGGTNRWGYGLGSNADMQYHAGGAGLNGRHDFYSGGNLRFRVSIDGAELTGSLKASAGISTTQLLVGTTAGVHIQQGGASNTGYIEFIKADASRAGYIGFGDSAANGDINMLNENGGAWRVNGGVKLDVNPNINNLVDDGSVNISGGSTLFHGGTIILRGIGQAFRPGCIDFQSDAGGILASQYRNGQWVIGGGGLAFDGVSVCRLQVADGIAINMVNTGPQSAMSFFNGQGTGTRVGWIGTVGSTTSYNTTCDATLKENITDCPDPGAILDALQIRSFDWINDGVHQDYGLIAQEAEEAFPFPVNTGPDGIKGVDLGAYVPLLIKELQSVRSRLAYLEGYGERK